jgi:O-antigen/teichoic acid export membrane protein
MSAPRLSRAMRGTGLSLRSNFAWVLCGNVVYAACQLGMVIALAKLGSSTMLGQFSLGLAIATPVLMFSNLHLRAVQATDAARRYSFRQYLNLRIAMTSAALLAVAGIAWFGNYGRETRRIIAAVALAKAIEALSDVHYGLFQLNDRLDRTGQSMMLRGLLSAGGMATALYLTREAFWGCIGLALVWLICLLFFDMRQARRFGARHPGRRAGRQRYGSLIRLALPMGLVTTTAALNLHMPRYFIQSAMGEHQLGIFSAMAYATVAMILVSDCMGHCAIPRLARLYAAGSMPEFRSLLVKLLGFGAALGLAGVATAQILGERLLAFFYGPEYAASSGAFVVLILATAIYCIANVFTGAITATRSFRIQVPLYAVAAGANALACSRWVPAFGLIGGAAAMAVAGSVQLVLGAAVMSYLLLARPKTPGPSIGELETAI